METVPQFGLMVHKGTDMRENFSKKIKYIYFKTSVVMLFFGALFLPSLTFF